MMERCRSCGTPDPPMRERSKTDQLFCDPLCQKIYYAEVDVTAAAPIGDGIFEILIALTGPHRTYRERMQIFVVMLRQHLGPAPTNIQKAAYVAKHLHLMSSEQRSNERNSQEDEIFDIFFAPSHAVDVFNLFGMSQDRLANHVYYEALRGASLSVVTKLLSRYGRDPFALPMAYPEDNPSSNVFYWLRMHVTLHVDDMEQQARTRKRAAAITRALVERADFGPCAWDLADTRAIPLRQQNIRQNVVLLLAQDASNLDRVRDMVAVIPTTDPLGLGHALWSESADMVRLMLQHGWLGVDPWVEGYELLLSRPETSWTLTALQLLLDDDPGFVAGPHWGAKAAQQGLSTEFHLALIPHLNPNANTLYHYVVAGYGLDVLGELVERPAAGMMSDEQVINAIELVVVNTVISASGDEQEYATSETYKEALIYLNWVFDLAGSAREHPLPALIGGEHWKLLDQYESFYLGQEFWTDVGKTGDANVITACWTGKLNNDRVYFHFALALVACATTGNLQAVVDAFLAVMARRPAYDREGEKYEALEELVRRQEPSAAYAVQAILDAVDFETNNSRWRAIVGRLGEYSHTETLKVMRSYAQRKAEAAASRRTGEDQEGRSKSMRTLEKRVK
jgi:hypothetical protein